MTDPLFLKLLRTRLLVAALGEILPLPWWRTNFLKSVGLSRLALVVPRTFRLAALEGVTAAARRDHDALVAPQSYHLFRLPSVTEHRLRKTAEAAAVDNQDLLIVPAKVDDLLAELAPPDDLTSPAAHAPGPRRIAKVRDVLSVPVIATLASAYAHAARDSYRTQPYFEA